VFERVLGSFDEDGIEGEHQIEEKSDSGSESLPSKGQEEHESNKNS
jgi:hypothetical protein